MDTLFTIQDDDVYWNGQLVAKLVVPASTLREQVENYLLQSGDALDDDYEDEAYDAGYEDGFADGKATREDEQN